MRRVRKPELMDQPGVDPGELETSLRDLRAVNRWLGGRISAVRHTLDIVRRVPWSPATILDVGTGGGDLPVALARSARRRGVELRIIATDLHSRTVELAREATQAEPWIDVRQADALALPFADGAFDVAMCCTMIHHFSELDAVQILREMDRVARYGIVVTDLARSAVAVAGSELLASTAWRDHPVTRHDGPVSVRAAFTVPEMRELARRAGVQGRIRVRREPVFRLALVADRTAAPRRQRVGGRAEVGWAAQTAVGRANA